MITMQSYIIFDKKVSPTALYRAESLELALKPYPPSFTAIDTENLSTATLAEHLAAFIVCPKCKSHAHTIKDTHSDNNQYRIVCQDCKFQYQPTKLYRGIFPDGLTKTQRYAKRNRAKISEKQRLARQAKRKTEKRQ